MTYSVLPDSQELADEVSQSVRIMEIQQYGKDRLAAGPAIDESDEVIVVEGRADVLNLLKHGIKNAIAMNGTSCPDTIKELSSKKIITAFVDGDRGGDLIIKELTSVADIDHVTKAPDGKEVEELTKKEIYQCLKNKRKVGVKINKKLPENFKEKLKPIIKDMLGTKEVKLLDSDLKEIHKTSYDELPQLLKTAELDNVSVILMDGKLTKELAEQIEKKGINLVVCFDSERFKTKMKVLCIHDF